MKKKLKNVRKRKEVEGKETTAFRHKWKLKETGSPETVGEKR